MSVFGITWRDATSAHLTDYITFLMDTSDLSAATIRSRISAISHYYKLKLNFNPGQSYASELLLKSLHKRCGTRKLLPITKDVLQRLLRVLYTYDSRYLTHMFYVMYTFLYLLALRISELVQYSHKFNHSLNLQDVSLNNNKLLILVKSGKHNTSPMSYELDCYPRLFWHYTQFLRLRGDMDGTLFRFRDNSPVSRTFFTKQLKEDIEAIGLDSTLYNSHSFRAGRTSDLALEGVSDRQIALIGRWRSDAFREYIRQTCIAL